MTGSTDVHLKENVRVHRVPFVKVINIFRYATVLISITFKTLMRQP